MKKHQVIIIEDDVDLANLTADFLHSFEFDCKILHSAVNAVQEIIAHQPSLVLLDVMLPDGDGLDICRQIKPKYKGKVVMLTARTELIDQVLGLEIGADDYITKPVEPRLLLAKCRAVLRREEVEVESEQSTVLAAPSIPSSTIRFSHFEIDTVRREVFKHGQLQAFSNPEYELLVLLVERKGEIVSRDDVFQRLRGIDYDGQSRQIDIYISNIRQKLGDNSLIKTIRSKGYVFVG